MENFFTPTVQPDLCPSLVVNIQLQIGYRNKCLDVSFTTFEGLFVCFVNRFGSAMANYTPNKASSKNGGLARLFS